MSSPVWLDLAPAHGRGGGSLALEVPTVKATVPVDGPPLTLRWGSSAEPFDAGDYTVLALLLTIGGGITPNAWDSIVTLALLSVILSRATSRGALLAVLRKMQGR